MSEVLKKPYQISIWEDELVGSGNDSYYREVKIADIGSDTMTSKNRVYSPVLTENMNGEQTLTFSLKYKYFDEVVGDFVVNPFVSFLVNERKVKLFYKDKWRDFVIKEREEESEEYTFSYTCTDASVQELSKNGYGITFDAELGNNQGTIIELGKQALEGTDWIVDEEDCDLLQQTVSEPIYECTVQDSFEAYNVDKDENVTIEQDEIIYVFYSYINNKITEFVQFLRAADREKWSYDDNGAIIGTNYRLPNPVTYTEKNDSIVINYGTAAINVGPVSTEHQGYRLVYNSLSKYDSVLEKTVDLYQVKYNNDTQDIYHYTDTEYVTASSLSNFATNGGNFSYFDKTTIDGWDNAVMGSGNSLHSMRLTTYPEILATTPLVEVTRLNELRGYLELYYPASDSKHKYNNSFYNSGILDHSEELEHIAIGDKFLLRLRYQFSLTKHGQLLYPRLSNNTVNLRAVVAKYTNVEKKLADGSKITVKQVEPGSVYFDFNGEFREANTIISGGQLINNQQAYILDGVIQTPSKDYVYQVINSEGVTTDYVWVAADNQYKVKAADNFANYYYTIAEAKRALPRSVLNKTGTQIGLFLYNQNNAEQYVYLEDIEITRYAEDKNNNPIFLGTAPEVKINTVDYYYLKPEDGMTADEVNLYTSLDSIADDLFVDKNSIIPIRNEKCEKILSINENQSNCFNILQTLCETFECWLKISVEHEENGRIKLDDANHPIKKISFKKYVGKENFAGFRYGINLSSISRSINSDEFVTKLIVGQSSSDYTDSGVLDISEAKSNPTGESYILNFDYYLKQGLINNPEKFKTDLLTFNQNIKKINNELQNYNKEYTQLGNVHERASVNYTLYTELYDNAAEEYAKALQQFESLNNGLTYQQYINSNPKESDLVDNETLRTVVDKIYSNAILVNNYKQLSENAKKEFLRLDLQYNGAKDYSFVISTSNAPLTKLVLSDYVEGFECDFVREENGTIIREPWTSTLLEKEFEDEIIYKSLVIKKIPANYQIEYIINDNKINSTVDEPINFTIYDEENEKGLVKKIRLIPLKEYDDQHQGLQEKIDKLLEEKHRIERNFYSKYSRFIQEGTWESSEYIDSELYYLDAVQVSNTSAQPQVSYNINVVEISEIEEMENYDFDIGDKTYIEDTDFFGWYIYEENGVQVETPVKEEVVVSEIEWHLDEPDYNVITIQNYKTQFQDLFQRISATVQSVEYNQASYLQAANILDPTGNINSNLLIGSLNAIAGQSFDLASNGALKTTSEGLIVRNLTEPGNLLIIKSRGIEKSNDGGRTWDNLISAEGVNTEQLTAGTINTQNILIMDGNNPNFRWDKAGLSAYGYGQKGDYDLKTYVRYDKYGLYGVKDGENYVASSLDDIKEKANFGLTWDGFFIKNKYRNGYVSISSTDDFQVVANDQERIKIGATEFEEDGITPSKYGILIKNDEGKTVFETDDDGNLTITGTINAEEGGTIGGFTIGKNELFNGDFGDTGSIFLSTGYESSNPISGSQGDKTWSIAVGNNFGVDTAGTLYATGANIRGNIIADSGTFRGTIYADSGQFTGYVNAQGGTFNDLIQVGSSEKKHIAIKASDTDAQIYSSDYKNNSTTGWMIDSAGDAIFNNVSVRGAIKTAVFEYSEIEAVGGAFLFRPSSSIKSAVVEGNDLKLTVEKHLLFNQDEWVKVSNCNDESSTDQAGNLLNDGGLTHVYKIKNNPKQDRFILLENAAKDFYDMIEWDTTDVIVDTDTGEFIETENSEDISKVVTTTIDENFNSENIYNAVLDFTYTNSESQIIDEPISTQKIYHFNLNNIPYTKVGRSATWTLQLRDVPESTEEEAGDGADDLVEIITREVTYVGNFSIIERNHREIDEIENFVIVSFDGETRLYTTEEVSWFFKLYDSVNLDAKLIHDLEGGSLISFGYHTSSQDYESGIHNYGIGINSSDNYIALPQRAISLFETTIHPGESVKVSYDFKGILGTLPPLGTGLVNESIYTENMVGTQGIFTNNMYIGDNKNFITYYYDKTTQQYRLIINADTIYEGYDDDDQPIPITPGQDGKDGKDGEDAILVRVDSSAGNVFLHKNISTTLTCTVTKGNGTDITNQVTRFTWIKKDANGVIDSSWSRPLAGRSITLTEADVDSKAIFVCEVEF